MRDKIMIGTKVYRVLERMGHDPLEPRATFTDANGKVWVEQRPRTPWVSSVVEYEIVSFVEVKISGANVDGILRLMPWETEEYFSNRYILNSKDEEPFVLNESEMNDLQNGNFDDFYINKIDAEKESEKRNANR